MNINSEVHFIALLWTGIAQRISVFSGPDAEMLHLSFCTDLVASETRCPSDPRKKALFPTSQHCRTVVPIPADVSGDLR